MIRREILKEVLLDNRNEVVKHQVIPRSFQFEEFGNYVFVGIRRAGKSFLLYQRIQELLHNGHTWNEMLYVNFEDERLIGMTAADLNLILEVHAEMSTDRPMLFLDEIQNIDGWDKFVRRLADNKYRAYVTGSNAKMLSQDVATTLGGRYITVHVYPYDFKEFLYANGVEVTENSLFATESRAEIKRIFNDYFRSGGFPEGASLAAKRDYLTSVYQKIYLGDIAARHSIENTFALRILFRKLAESIKQPVSFTRITNIVASTGVKISKNTVINYMEYAKDACLLIPIQNIADKLVPGMGASMRTPAVARLSAMSSARPVMRLIFTPARGCSSYRVTDGPRLISIIRVCTPKLDSVFTSRSALCVSSSSTPFSSVGCCLRKRLRGG